MENDDAELRLLKAQYYMNAANTLVLTGTIFILGFVSALAVLGPKADLLREIMLGLVPLGLIALYDGISHYFRGQNLLKPGKPAPSKKSGPARLWIDAIGYALLMTIFLAVNWLMYDTLIPSVVTIFVLCLSTLFVAWIRVTVEK